MTQRRHDLTAMQAQRLSQIELKRRAIIKEWNAAVELVGLDPVKIVGGNLNDDPHLLVDE